MTRSMIGIKQVENKHLNKRNKNIIKIDKHDIAQTLRKYRPRQAESLG